MKSLLALGVTQLSDAYPNIKYKLELLARLKGFDCSEQLCILNNRAGPRRLDRDRGLISEIF